MPLPRLNRRLCLMIGMVLPLLSAFAFSESTAPSPDKVAVEAKPNLLAELVDDRESGFGFNSFEKTLFSNINVLNCDRTKVVITTTCGNGKELYCFNQNVAFIIETEQESYRQIHYDHPYRNGSEPFIYGAACAKFKQKYYVVLDSTDYNNCRDCEWSDVFTSAGQYVWSTRGYKGTTSFKRKLITYKLFVHFVEHSDWTVQANGKVDISISHGLDESKK